MSRRKTTSEFVSISREKHGDRYDYSHSKYMGCDSKIDIICKKHGLFSQRATKHMRGEGCIKCGFDKLSHIFSDTLELFVEKSIAIHGDIYDYSKVIYKNQQTKVEIICKEHGSFFMTPNNHLSKGGQNCPTCTRSTQGISQRSTTEEFIEKATLMHGDKFDYSKVEYTKNNALIEVICKKHGWFNVSPSVHLNQDGGCRECANEKQREHRSHGLDGFIQAAKNKHGDKFSYSLITKYKNNLDKVKIICREHGEFTTVASSHLSGKGSCPKCSAQTDNDCFYLWRDKSRMYNGERVYKVGVTSFRLGHKRLKKVARSGDCDQKIILFSKVSCNARIIEKMALDMGQNPKLIPFDGSTEFRAYDENEIQEITRIAEAAA